MEGNLFEKLGMPIADLAMDFLLKNMPEFRKWSCEEVKKLAADTDSPWDDKLAQLYCAWVGLQ